jgi:hypothetical protein
LFALDAHLFLRVSALIIAAIVQVGVAQDDTIIDFGLERFSEWQDLGKWQHNLLALLFNFSNFRPHLLGQNRNLQLTPLSLLLPLHQDDSLFLFTQFLKRMQ